MSCEAGKESREKRGEAASGLRERGKILVCMGVSCGLDALFHCLIYCSSWCSAGGSSLFDTWKNLEAQWLGNVSPQISVRQRLKPSSLALKSHGDLVHYAFSVSTQRKIRQKLNKIVASSPLPQEHWCFFGGKRWPYEEFHFPWAVI